MPVVDEVVSGAVMADGIFFCYLLRAIEFQNLTSQNQSQAVYMVTAENSAKYQRHRTS